VRLLENLRFSPGEKNNDPAFVASLVEGEDLYVNDAFGVCHRTDASVVGPPQLLRCAAGRLIQREVEQLGRLLENPERPFVVVIGGAKVADKLGLLDALAARADLLLIGGAMAFTFTQALGFEAGASPVDASKLEACKALMSKTDNVVLPMDFVAAGPGVELRVDNWGSDPAQGTGVVATLHEVTTCGQSIPKGWKGYDVGPATAELFCKAIVDAGAVLWNGPMGVFEDERFAAGTKAVAHAVAASAGRTVIGGGDTVAAVNRYGLSERIDHVSTGGGASLALLEHGDLAGLAALRESPYTVAPEDGGEDH
jgi:phosphoglycerate kinase